MAIILIKPVHLTSNGGYPVILSGIDPLSYDCLAGEIKTGAGLIQANWDLSGTMRGGTDPLNLAMSDSDFVEVADLAKHLGAKR